MTDSALRKKIFSIKYIFLRTISVIRSDAVTVNSDINILTKSSSKADAFIRLTNVNITLSLAVYYDKILW